MKKTFLKTSIWIDRLCRNIIEAQTVYIYGIESDITAKAFGFTRDYIKTRSSVDTFFYKEIKEKSLFALHMKNIFRKLNFEFIFFIKCDILQNR